MAIVRVKPTNDPTPYIRDGGQYGPGLQHEADVELLEFESPKAESGPDMLDRMPAFDREGTKGDLYYRFNFQIVTDNGAKYFVTEWVTSTRKLEKWLQALGVPVAKDDEGYLQFDDQDVAPRKVGGIDIKPPRQDKNDPDRFYTGGIRQLIGA